MKQLGYVLIALGLIALANGCRIGGRHTIIAENGNGKDIKIEYWGHTYFTADSTGIRSISPNGMVKYKNGDRELEAESNYQGQITYQVNGGEKQQELNESDKRFLAMAVKDMMKRQHNDK